jgi:tripartite-type tricarboxylate transporter receptor subunit TctC
LRLLGRNTAALVPDVATLTKSGFTGHDASAWFALSAPKGTPEPIVTKLHAEATKMIVNPAVSERLTAMGGRSSPTGPKELGERIETIIATLTDVLKDVPKQK